MITNKYALAGQVIELRSMYRSVHYLWRDYVTDAEATIVIEMSEADVAEERRRAKMAAEREGRSELYSNDEQFEALAAYRKVSEKLTEYGVLLFHGSAIAVDGEAYIFTAPSGTGKSTHTALWRRYLGDRAVMINDDKPLIRVGEDGATVYGTPYNGKHRLGTNSCAPLRAICILGRGERNEICEIDARDAYRTIVQQTLRPRSAEAMARTLALIDELKKHVRFYRLSCNMEIDAARVAYEGMRGNK